MKSITLTLAFGMILILGASAQNAKSELFKHMYNLDPDSTKWISSGYDSLKFDKGLKGYKFRKNDFFKRRNPKSQLLYDWKLNPQDSLKLKEFGNQLPQLQREYKNRFILPGDSQKIQGKTPKNLSKNKPYIYYSELDNMPIYVPGNIYMPNKEVKSNDNMPNPMLKQKDNSAPSLKFRKEEEKAKKDGN